MKRQLAAAMPALIREPTPEGLTQTEHRLRRLEATIDQSVERITPMLCMRVCNHPRAASLCCVHSAARSRNGRHTGRTVSTGAVPGLIMFVL